MNKNIDLMYTLLQLIQEFALVANILSDNFDKNLLMFSQKIILYAEVESQKEVKRLLHLFKEIDNPSIG